MKRLAIDVQPGEYSVARLDPAEGVPAELFAHASGALVSVTRTDSEVSVICPTHVWRAFSSAGTESSGRAEEGWRLLSVRGPLEFTLTGIIAALSSELAAAGVALFSLSTYDTDHLLVKATDLARAVDALELSGHDVHSG
ncbi:MAG: ACT domain-containing protein [Actinophytocola sp.]|nr:ACT domain-containing protein [Actinophytocola sp.]